MSGAQHFDQFAYQWWNPNGPLRTLHHINPVRLGFMQQHIGKGPMQAIIDVGCGGGIFTEAIAPYAKRVLGIDTNASAINTAQQHCQQSPSTAHITYQCCEVAEAAQQYPGQFDVVTCLELLEHVDQPQAIIASCATLCKPSGHLFFSTINRHPKAFLLAIVGAEYLLHLIPKGTHHYAQLIKPDELDRCARKHALRLQALTGLHYNPFTKSAKLCDDVRVNYLAYYRK